MQDDIQVYRRKQMLFSGNVFGQLDFLFNFSNLILKWFMILSKNPFDPIRFIHYQLRKQKIQTKWRIKSTVFWLNLSTESKISSWNIVKTTRLPLLSLHHVQRHSVMLLLYRAKTKYFCIYQALFSPYSFFSFVFIVYIFGNDKSCYSAAPHGK